MISLIPDRIDIITNLELHIDQLYYSNLIPTGKFKD
jgi:hypothetical protein